MGNRGKKRSRLDRGNYGYLFIAPFFLVFLVFGLYPIVYTVYLSFQKWDGLGPISYLGLKNFTRLLGDEVFYLSVWNSFRIWLCNFIPQMAAALLLAFIFTFNRVRGMKFFRAAYYLPNLVTAASVGLLFNLLFNGNKSAVNYILTALNIPGAPFDFFNSESVTSAMVSYIQWWMWFGYTTVITRVTLPLIRPTLIYMTITSIIGGMQLFDVPSTLTNMQGDPRKAILTTSMYLYNQGFKNHNYGYASAVSVGLFIIIAILSFFALRAMRKRGDIYND